ncbi:MAG: zinc ribbon domain-containing protein [Deltaproteobacteria bacterium]|nr:zinc ribbon domain-containing protein [Deltaproteobacteria bacterium]
MPIYEYQCQKCQEHFEVVQKFKDKPLKKCTACGGKLQKLISQSSFHLKGSGWYVTDYVRKGQKDKKDGEPKPEKTSESTSSSKADNKPEKKKETAGTKD